MVLQKVRTLFIFGRKYRWQTFHRSPAHHRYGKRTVYDPAHRNRQTMPRVFSCHRVQLEQSRSGNGESLAVCKSAAGTYHAAKQPPDAVAVMERYFLMVYLVGLRESLVPFPRQSQRFVFHFRYLRMVYFYHDNTKCMICQISILNRLLFLTGISKRVIMNIETTGGVLWKYGSYAIFLQSQERKT